MRDKAIQAALMANPDAVERPAFELAVRALERKYPCDPEDLKDMEDADSPAE